jgi:hypothetical protein
MDSRPCIFRAGVFAFFGFIPVLYPLAIMGPQRFNAFTVVLGWRRPENTRLFF